MLFRVRRRIDRFSSTLRFFYWKQGASFPNVHFQNQKLVAFLNLCGLLFVVSMPSSVSALPKHSYYIVSIECLHTSVVAYNYPYFTPTTLSYVYYRLKTFNVTY
jgi:hypothetical protein